MVPRGRGGAGLLGGGSFDWNPAGPRDQPHHQLQARQVGCRELIALLTIATATIPSITIATGAGNRRPLVLLLAGGTVCRTSATLAATNVIRGGVATIPTAERRQ